jgi:Ran GTPase-activating protein (RanGAP) involved in mRNA processing and transport
MQTKYEFIKVADLANYLQNGVLPQPLPTIIDRSGNQVTQSLCNMSGTQISLTKPKQTGQTKNPVKVEITFNNATTKSYTLEAIAFADLMASNPPITYLDVKYSNIYGCDNALMIIEELKTNKTLEHLRLTAQKIPDAAGSKIYDLLKVNTTIQTLDLRRNKLGSYTGLKIAEALKVNSSVKVINLSDNSINAGGLTHIANVLKTNKTVQSLNLSDNDLAESDAPTIATILKTNKTLKCLDVSNNKFDKTCCNIIFNALLENKTLEEFNFNRNELDFESAKLLVKVINTHPTLRTLGISDTKLANDGATLIVKAMQTNKTITSINLSDFNGKIEDICELLQTNTTLKSLNLASSNIGNEDGKKLEEALKTNITLTDCELDNNDDIDDDSYNTIKAHLDRNQKLEDARNAAYSNGATVGIYAQRFHNLGKVADRSMVEYMASFAIEPQDKERAFVCQESAKVAKSWLNLVRDNQQKSVNPKPDLMDIEKQPHSGDKRKDRDENSDGNERPLKIQKTEGQGR